MCNACQLQVDTKDEDGFADRMLSVIEDASLALMISVGHRTGLFDVLAELPPVTSVELASRASLNERYVREWLGAMVTGQVVDFDPVLKQYSLPPAHARWLTRSAAPNNMAVPTQWIALLGSVENRIVDCFRNGGGVPYSAYARFHEVMAEESDQTTASSLIESVLPLQTNLVESLRAGMDVLDVGCGRGHALMSLAAEFPHSRFTGYDFADDAVRSATREARERGLVNVRFEQKDVSRMDEWQCYDLITAFDAIHDQANPAEVLNQIHAALRPSGLFLMQDIAASSFLEKNLERPLATFFYTVSCMHCMTVSLEQGGEGLGAAWGQELAGKMLVDAGFQPPRVDQLEHDIINYYYWVTK